jgi:hypothetical protein
MSDPDDQPSPAASPPTRSAEASRRLSQLLARPLGSPAPQGEAPEPYVPRPVRAATPPPPEPAPEAAPAPQPPDDTASVAAPPPGAPAEPDLPWFDPPAPPKPAVEVAATPEAAANADEATAPLGAASEAHEERRDEPAGSEEDLFDRREPPPLHVPPAPEDEFDFGGDRRSRHRVGPESTPRAHDQVPEWAWPSALDRGAADAAPAQPVDLDALPKAAAPEPAPPAPPQPAAPAPPAARPLDPDATRTLGNIRRLMLASNLFVVVAIAAVLTVVGYRLYRTEPAPPASPPAVPIAAPAPAKIPLDMTLTLPRGARIVQSAVAGDRLVITLEIDGATEIRTFDIKTLQPTGRMSFATVP